MKGNNMKTLRVGCIAAVLLIPAFKSGAVNLSSQMQGHRSGLKARVPGFRVLYISGATGGRQKLDLAKIWSLEFPD